MIKNNSKNNKYSNLIVYTLLFNYGWDFISAYYTERGSGLAAIRGILLLMFFVIPFLKKIKLIKPFNSIFLFILFVTLIIPFSSDITYSLRFSIKVFIILSMMPIGYFYINTYEKFNKLNRTIPLLMTIVLIIFLYANIFDLGSTGYVSDSSNFLRFGGLSDNFNVITYLLLISPLGFLSMKNMKEKIYFALLLIINIVILLISMKRIAIAGSILGLFIFVYYYRKKTKFLKISLIIAIILVIISPMYFSYVETQFNVRKEQGRFESNTLESETRYKETLVVWNEVLSMKNPLKSLLGLEAFYSIGLYGKGAFNRRQIHVDYNLILFTCGIIGFLLYLNIYIQIYRKISFVLRKTDTKSSLLINTMKAVFFSLFFSSLFTSFAGQMEGITFRTIIFLYMGSILKLLKQESYHQKVLQLNKKVKHL